MKQSIEEYTGKMGVGKIFVTYRIDSRQVEHTKCPIFLKNTYTHTHAINKNIQKIAEKNFPKIKM